MEEAEATGWVRPVPNLLSGIRLTLAAFFPFAASAWRLPVVVGAGMTDWLDGFVARRYGVASTAGGILDSIADKAFTLSVLVTLAVERELTLAEVLLLLVRDLVVLVVASYYALRREWQAFHAMPSRWPGKIATMCLFLFFVALLLPGVEFLHRPLFALAVTASTVAGLDYLRRFVCSFARP